MKVEAYVTEDGALRVLDPKGLDRALLKLLGQPVTLEVKRKVKGRSMPQNRYYWGVVVHLISGETGYTPEEVHEILRAEFLREPAGFGVPGRIKSTTELTTAEAESYFSRIREWASAELGLYIPEPNEEVTI